MNLTEEQLETSWRDQEAVLNSLFNSEIDSTTAAQKLASIVLPRPPPDQDDEDEDDDTMAYLEGMWKTVIETLEEHSSRAQTVCNLIICISQLPPALTQSGKQLCEENRRVWQDVPRLGMALRDEWNSESAFLVLSHENIGLLSTHRIDVLAQRGGAETTRFTGVNALIRHLMLRDIKLFPYALSALWTMRNALEYPLPDSGRAPRKVKGQREQSLCSIPAAVRLVEVIGELMYSWYHEFEHSPLQAPGGGGPLWSGKHGFCRERWNLWLEKFVVLSCDDGLEGMYRDESGKAAVVMSAIEQN
jgi:hypothetical protein